MENRETNKEIPKLVCVDCIKNDILKNIVQKQNLRKKCNYCKNVRAVVSITDLAEKLKSAIDRKYEPSHYADPANYDRDPKSLEALVESDSKSPKTEFKFRELIQQLTGCGEQIVEDLRSWIETKYKNPNDPTTHDLYTEKIVYTESQSFNYRSEMLWIDLEVSLVEEARFFNSTAKKILDLVFGDKAARNYLSEALEYVGPNCEQSYLYRARTFQSKNLLLEALNKCDDYGLGPPPALCARAGRVNPHGVSVFYGAYNAEVALTETRPTVGSFVLVGKFDIQRELTLLNLTSLENIYVEESSIFETDYEKQLQKIYFLRHVLDLYAEPVLSDDDPKSYLITQFIAEYLSSMQERNIDGIIYPSVQYGKGELNVAIFHKSARCEIKGRIDDPIEDEDELAEYYKNLKLNRENVSFLNTYRDKRPINLSLDIGSLRVHLIESAKFGSQCTGLEKNIYDNFVLKNNLLSTQ